MPDLNIILVLAVLAAATALFITERLRIDLAAMTVLVALLLLRLIDPGEALYGFANAGTGTVACMFVLSAGLTRTGLVEYLARRIDRLAGRREGPLLLTLLVAVALISAFISNTATVAVFIPVAIALARRRDITGSRVLMPLSFASQLGGVSTLIGTSSNILVNAIAVSAGVAAFGIFEFARLGALLAVIGTAYLVLAGRRLLPRREAEMQKIDKYRLTEYLAEFRVRDGSRLAGKTWKEIEGLKEGESELTRIIRDDTPASEPSGTRIEPGDILLVRGRADRLMHLKVEYGLETRADEEISDRNLSAHDVKLVEVLVPPESSFVGRTLAGSHIFSRFGCVALALQRRGKILRERLVRIPLEESDTLLLQCQTRDVQRLLGTRDLVVTDELTDLYIRRNRAVIALCILVSVLVIAALNVVSLLMATLIGAVAMVLTGCLRIDEVYRSIDWKIIFLLGGVLPLGLALEKTGGAAWLANVVLAPATAAGPLAALATVYIITAILTEVMSNNAPAVLLAPVGLSVAGALHLDPRPFLVAIAFAASTSFATPFGYQTNAMVYSAGAYRFTDFTKIGLPLKLILGTATILLIPHLWPL